MFNLLLLVLMPAAFALNPIAGRALTGVYAPGQLTSVRWFAAGVLIAAFVAWQKREKWRVRRGGWWRILVLGAIGTGVCGYCAYASAQVGTATNVSLIYATTAAFVVLYEIATRQVRPGIMLITGVALCLAGVMVIVTRGELGLIAAIKPNIGDLWALVGMAGWTVYTIAMKKEDSGLGPLALLAVMGLAGAAAAFPIAVVETARLGPPGFDPGAIAWVTALVLFASLGSYLAYNLSIQRVGPIITSAAISLTPFHTAVLAMLLIGEQLAWFHAAGGGLVVAGLATISFSRSRS